MHRISLKKYYPIMLLRNFDPANGHCNGTRYTVMQLNSHVIEAVTVIGPHSGKHLFIPQISLVPSNNQLQRREFPIKLIFSFTANKSQGQTVDSVGVFLSTLMFTHGQLYVTMSRGKDSANLKISVNQTQNIIYKEVL
uniref:DNA helicase Pif1-like 2B domain-containing protein n=1 Tax=Octopus bimaculoides TaxID=37653 RepID=A0A0L8GQ59_OCTBM